MEKIDANNLKNGQIIEYNNENFVILKTMHTKPGKGPAYMQVEMKNLKTNTKISERFRSSDKLTKVDTQQTDYIFLYKEGDQLVLMDEQNFEQVSVNENICDNQCKPFLKENMRISVIYYNNVAGSLLLPENVTMTVIDCEAVVKGQTATSSYKSAFLENNIKIMVPPFINIGDKIIVKVLTNEYVERAK